MKVFVGVPCGDLARYPEFWLSLTCQHLPSGGTIRFGMGRGCYIDDNQNHLGRLFLNSDCDYFFLANDDQIYAPDTIARLLSCDAPVAVPLCLTRQPPFFPLVYDRTEADGYKVIPRFLQPGDRGVVEVLASGGGGMLVSRKVMETIGDPWWQNTAVEVDGREIHIGEDVSFCRKVRAAGFKIVCDLDAVISHTATFNIRPQRTDEGQWVTALERHGTMVAIPAATESQISLGANPPTATR